MTGLMYRPGEQFFPCAAFPQQKHGHITHGRSLRPAGRVTYALAIPHNTLKSFYFLWTFTGQTLPIRVRLPQQFRDEIHREIKRDFGLPVPVSMRLVKRGGILALPQQHPDGGHRGRAGTEMDAQLRIGVRPFIQGPSPIPGQPR